MSFMVPDPDHIPAPDHQRRLRQENLFSAPDKKELIKSLYQRVLNHHKEYSSPTVDWLKEIDL